MYSPKVKAAIVNIAQYDTTAQQLEVLRQLQKRVGAGTHDFWYVLRFIETLRVLDGQNIEGRQS